MKPQCTPQELEALIQEVLLACEEGKAEPNGHEATDGSGFAGAQMFRIQEPLEVRTSPAE